MTKRRSLPCFLSLTVTMIPVMSAAAQMHADFKEYPHKDYLKMKRHR